jgi:hypothetical protein
MTTPSFVSLRSEELLSVGPTFKQGSVVATIAELEALFGPPQYFDPTGGSSSTLEWDVRFADGVLATIYDTYDDIDWVAQDTPLPQKQEWSIGGSSQMAAIYIKNLLTSSKASAS